LIANYQIKVIVAYKREGGGGTSCTPSKDFEKLYHKNAIKHGNSGPPPRFSHNPMYLPQKNLKITAHL
jgi:hypothetical protein